MRAGHTLTLPELPGRWSVWSQSDEGPGAHFFVPCNDEARAAGIKFAVVRVTHLKGTADPLLTVLRTEAANTPQESRPA